MPLLHLFYLGGNAGRSNIEVHDVQFVACDAVEEAIPALKAAWFGDADKVHIDGYQIVNWADGYAVDLVQGDAGNGGLGLYFVNVGGYLPHQLAEAHEFGLFVAESADAAKEKAKRTLLLHHELQHKDNLKDVDDCLLLAEVDGWQVRLREDAAGQALPPAFQGYWPI
ncbi:MAG: DUF1543 domain-containing protein [Cardiobacteriaceae bacterium]|nr:DUF1543 domain-containing protein [Cardiobacteriaceae bacterium]